MICLPRKGSFVTTHPDPTPETVASYEAVVREVRQEGWQSRYWPADKTPGASRGLTDAEAALLAQLQRRPHALNKRERDQIIKLLRKQR